MADASTSTGDVTMVRANSLHLPWFPGPGCKAQGVLEPSRASLRFTKTPLDWMEKRRTNQYVVGEPGGLRGTLPIASAPFLSRQGLSCLSPGRGWGAGERSASRAGRSGPEGQSNESPGPSSLLPANPISRSPWCTLQAPALSQEPTWQSAMDQVMSALSHARARASSCVCRLRARVVSVWCCDVLHSGSSPG